MPRKALRIKDVVTVPAEALGLEWAQQSFPDTWQTARVQGWVEDKSPSGAGWWLVKFLDGHVLDAKREQIEFVERPDSEPEEESEPEEAGSAPAPAPAPAPAQAPAPAPMTKSDLRQPHKHSKKTQEDAFMQANVDAILDALNSELAPLGIKCRDMTKVVEADVERNYESLSVHLCKNEKNAAILCRTPALEKCFLSVGPNTQWIFMHRDNYYAVIPQDSFERTIKMALSIVFGLPDDCPICLEPFAINDGNALCLTCGHHAHKECADQAGYFKPGAIFFCPVCRAKHATVLKVIDFK